LAAFAGVTYVSGRAVARSRQWIGNRLTGTFVVDAINGANLPLGHAVTRMVVRHLLSPIALFGFIAALADGQRRAFHDRVASSLVITREREVWTAS
jgi:hypothetical protein